MAAACAGEPFHPAPGLRYNVLFIGNSLTAVNDLPHTVSALAATVNDSIEVEAATGSNLAVIDHINGATDAVDLIKKGGWDYVVLQQGPTSQQLGRDTLILASKMLEPLVTAAGGQIAELMAWPSSENRSSFDGALQSCKEAAQAVNGICFPAGQAWRAAWAFDPSLPLYGPDGYHPSELGTYLAALVIYEGGNHREECGGAAGTGAGQWTHSQYPDQHRAAVATRGSRNAASLRTVRWNSDGRDGVP